MCTYIYRWETHRTRKKINETKTWFLVKINNINKRLVKQAKERGTIQFNRIRAERGKFTKTLPR
jgi:hypothetical protein